MALRSKRNSTAAAWLCGGLALFASACGSRVDDQDSQTHWLGECTRDEQCSAGESCIEGACTPPIVADASTPLPSATPSASQDGAMPIPTSEVDAGSRCESLVVDDCTGVGCAAVMGQELNGVQQAYGCIDPERTCPAVITCAIDPEDSNHAVLFGSCLPTGWVRDMSEPGACAGAMIPDCESLHELECISTAACMAVYGRALDGSSRYGGCLTGEVSADTAEVCASDGTGNPPLLFSTTRIPAGWIEDPAGAAACELDCYSPWRNVDRIGDPDIGGCPCDSPGDVCLDGVGLICEDVTDDLPYHPYWLTSDIPCESPLTCAEEGGGTRLQYCLDHYKICTETGSIVLDEGSLLYCGDTPVECAARDEASCTDDCYPYFGRRAGEQTGEFIVCGDTPCSASITVCAADNSGTFIEFFGCVPPGWTEGRASACE